MKMKSIIAVASCLLALFVHAGTADVRAGVDLKINELTPVQVKHRFQSTRPRTASDAYMLALAHFSLGESREAIHVLEPAIKLFRTEEQKAHAYHTLARAHQANGNDVMAAKIADEAQSYNPDDIEIAKFRVAVHQNLKNNAFNADLARENLKRLDPEYDQTPVFLGEVAVITAFVGGVVLAYLIRDEKTPEGKQALGQVAKLLTASATAYGIYLQLQHQSQ